VHAHAGVIDHPVDGLTVRLDEPGEGATREEAPLHVLHTAFDLALVLGGPRDARRDHEAAVLGALAVGTLHLGIGDRRLDDPAFKLSRDDLARDAAEELEGVAVQRQPGPDRLVCTSSTY
jgi:hypothetical protein